MATIMQDGSAEDLIRSFTQLICAEGHYKTLVEKYDAMLQEGLTEDTSGTVEKFNDAIDELQELSELRRDAMRTLMNQYDGDVNYWCTVKHLAAAAYNAFEAWQASEDSALLNYYLSVNRRLIKTMTRWLGIEITECAACFADSLKQHGEEKGAVLDD